MTGKEVSFLVNEGSPVRGEGAPGPRPYGPMRLKPFLAIFVAMAWPAVGIALAKLAEMLFDIEVPKLVYSIFGLMVGFLGVYYIFPVVNHVPFGPVPLAEYTRRIGFYLPRAAWKHILLGVALAGCTLSGMLAALLLTGRYRLDWSTINLSQIVFSLNPGIFEEIFYRGVIVILLLRLTRSLKQALIFQILIFGLAHVKGLSWTVFFEVISVMVIAVGFTYAAYKTRCLLAGMVFHFLHDALLSFVQVPDGVFTGLRENALFYACLWIMVGVGVLITRFTVEKLGVRGEHALYTGEPGLQARPAA